MLCDKCLQNLDKNGFGDLTYDVQVLCTKCLSDKEKTEKESKSWYCYITRSKKKNKNWTYNGKTNDPKRRLRQHNGEIVGGAKQTMKTRPNEIFCLIKGFDSSVEAMQAEWRIRKPDKKRRKKHKFKGVDGRIRGLNLIFEDEQFTSNSQRKLKDMPLTMWLVKDKAKLLTKVPENINLIIVDKINLDLV